MHVWRGLGTGSFNGWTRNDTWATFYQFGQSFHPTGIGRIDFGGQLHGSPGGAPHLLDGRAQLAALRAVERRMGLGLAHTLLGGLDSRHDDLEKERLNRRDRPTR
jgi:hypothetical protein